MSHIEDLIDDHERAYSECGNGSDSDARYCATRAAIVAEFEIQRRRIQELETFISGIAHNCTQALRVHSATTEDK